MRRRRLFLLDCIKESQEIDVSKAVRARGEPRAADDGIAQELVDQPPGQLIDGCLLAGVQIPQLAALPGQLLLADPLGPASYRPDGRGERSLRLVSHDAGQVA
jgi:hypothetical protein